MEKLFSEKNLLIFFYIGLTVKLLVTLREIHNSRVTVKGDFVLKDLRKINQNHFMALMFLIMAVISIVNWNFKSLHIAVLFLTLIIWTFIENVVDAFRRIQVYENGVLTFKRFVMWNDIEKYRICKSNNETIIVELVLKRKFGSQRFVDFKTSADVIYKVKDLIDCNIGGIN